LYKDVQDAYEKVYKPGKVYEPNLELTKKYRQWFETYENIYPSLKDFNASLRATLAE
jgi:sugar (pentulose or hexulose) kinase